MFEAAFEFLHAEVSPRANEIDGNLDALRVALRGLCDCGLMALKRPEGYGGPACSEPEFRAFQEEVARASGALAFLQTQHQSAVGLIAKGNNEKLKQEMLPKMHGDEALTGIAFSQLRRSGPPITRATKTDGGYIINGSLPWATGHSLFRNVLLGAALDDGSSVFGIAPFTDCDTIKYSPPMRLAAMESAQTVSAELHSHFLPDELVVDLKPPGWILRNDMINITLQGFFAIGCARAGVDVIRQSAAQRDRHSLNQAAALLEKEIAACRGQLQSAQAASEETTQEKLELRAWAIDLAGRCSHAAVAASGGRANSLNHPAQRIVREAIVFTVSAQTEAIQEATLRRLTRS
ncbi:MAG: acyl-CoA/acyl-ACP dehydrogenase [Chthonomonas sp.]|nr:acyl-CoA/acyl-ACP dehydrogenase [Chthonomonas sp.]